LNTARFLGALFIAAHFLDTAHFYSGALSQKKCAGEKVRLKSAPGEY